MTWKVTIVHDPDAAGEHVVVETGLRNRVVAREWAKKHERDRHAENLKHSVFAPGHFILKSNTAYEQYGTNYHYVVIEIEPDEQENNS